MSRPKTTPGYAPLMALPRGETAGPCATRAHRVRDPTNSAPGTTREPIGASRDVGPQELFAEVASSGAPPNWRRVSGGRRPGQGWRGIAGKRQRDVTASTATRHGCESPVPQSGGGRRCSMPSFAATALSLSMSGRIGGPSCRSNGVRSRSLPSAASVVTASMHSFASPA